MNPSHTFSIKTITFFSLLLFAISCSKSERPSTTQVQSLNAPIPFPTTTIPSTEDPTVTNPIALSCHLIPDTNQITIIGDSSTPEIDTPQAINLTVLSTLNSAFIMSLNSNLPHLDSTSYPTQPGALQRIQLNLTHAGAHNIIATVRSDENGTEIVTCNTTITVIEQDPPVQAVDASLQLLANAQSGNIAVPFGSQVTLSWTSANADSCTLSVSGWAPFEVGTSGNILSAPLEDSLAVNMSCIGNGAPASKDIQITVNTPPQVVLTGSGSSNTHYIDVGESVTLNWNAQGVQFCLLYGSGLNNESVPLVGSRTITNITSDRTYGISCSDSQQVVSAAIDIKIKDPSGSFSVNGSTTNKDVSVGDNLHVVWDIKNASHCSLKRDGVEISGSATIGDRQLGKIKFATTLMLSCNGVGGTYQKTIEAQIACPNSNYTFANASVVRTFVNDWYGQEIASTRAVDAGYLRAKNRYGHDDPKTGLKICRMKGYDRVISKTHGRYSSCGDNHNAHWTGSDIHSKATDSAGGWYTARNTACSQGKYFIQTLTCGCS